MWICWHVFGFDVVLFFVSGLKVCCCVSENAVLFFICFFLVCGFFVPFFSPDLLACV